MPQTSSRLKVLTLALLGIILVQFDASSQKISWTKEYVNPATADLHDVIIMGADRVVAVGDNSVVQVGSVTASLLAVYGHRNYGALRSIDETSSGLLVAVGDDPVYTISSDSGITWTRSPNGVANARALSISKEKGAILVASFNGLYRAQGIDDNLVKVINGSFTSVRWITATKAIVGSSSGRVFVSEDSGNTWLENERFMGIGAVRNIRCDSTHTYIIFSKTVIVASSSGDTSSLEVSSNPYFSFDDALILDSIVVGVGSNQGFSYHAYSKDFGRTFKFAEAWASNASERLFQRGNTVAMVGRVGTYRLALIDSLHSSRFERFGFGTGNVVHAFSSFRAIAGSLSEYHCLVSGRWADVLRFSDSSKVVTSIMPPKFGNGTQGEDMLIVSDTIVVVADSSNFWMEGNTFRTSYRYVVFSSIDGAKTWRKLIAPELDSRLRRIVSTSDGRVILTGGERSYWYDVVNNQTTPIVCKDLLYTTSIVASGDSLMAIGDKVAISTNNGIDWVVRTVPFRANLICISKGKRIIAIGGSFVTGIGGEINIWISDDWGLQWRKTGSFQSIGKITAYDVDVNDSGYVIVTGQSRYVCYSMDNGETWLFDDQLVNFTGMLMGVQWVDSRTFLVSGNSEQVYRGTFDITSSVGQEQPPSEISLQLYPNPTRDKVSISTNGSSILDVALYDLKGNRVQASISVESSSAIADLHSLATGSYLLVVRTRSGIVSAIIVRD